MDRPYNGGGNCRGRKRGYRNLHFPPPEHFHAIYCDKANYGALSGSGVASKGAGFEAVVISGEHYHGVDTGGGASDRSRKGLRRAGGRGDGDGGRDGILRQGIL